MTCKDCAHYEACKMILLSAYPNVTEAEIIQTENNQTKCVNFKDKARFVELPCKVEDIVYIISEGDIIPLYVGCIENNHRGISILGFNEEYFGNKTITLYPDKQIIKWFLTREEAEKALKWRKKK